MAFIDQLGISALTPGMVVMGIIGLVLIYLAIRKQYEPLLLLLEMAEKSHGFLGSS